MKIRAQVGVASIVVSAAICLSPSLCAAQAARIDYRVLGMSRTSTMQKELSDAGAQGFDLVGMTVGQTAIGGEEVVSIMRRQR